MENSLHSFTGGGMLLSIFEVGVIHDVSVGGILAFVTVVLQLLNTALMRRKKNGKDGK